MSQFSRYTHLAVAIATVLLAICSHARGATYPTKTYLAAGDMARWSPDGSKIVFLNDTPYSTRGRPNVFVADADGSDIIQITSFRGTESSGQYGSAYGPAFRPGTNLVYWRDDRDGAWYASYAPADGSGTRTRTALGGAYQPLRFSSNGTSYATAFVSNTYRAIYSGSGDPPWNAGTTVRIMEGVSSTIEWGYGENANKLLYSRTVGSSTSIYLLNNSAPPANETWLLGDADQPSWAPDGQSVFFRRLLNGTYDIWSLNLGTSALLQWTNTAEEERFPVLSPDGKTLMFSVYDAAASVGSTDEVYRIFTADLTSIPEPSTMAAFSLLTAACLRRARRTA